MAKKALIITTVSGFVPQFEMNNVRILQEMGYEVHYASNFRNPVYGNDNNRLEGTGIIRHQVDFVRSPFRISANCKAYRQLRRVLEHGRYRLIHCHTPMGGVLGRIAAENLRRRHKEIVFWLYYTAHGFHFYRGAPFWYWMLYYPMERLLARKTDVLITINAEDFKKAADFKVRPGGRVCHLPGIGIQTGNIQTVHKPFFKKDDVVCFVSVGELTKRKNHELLIRAVSILQTNYPDAPKFLCVICGKGPLENKLKQMIAEKGLENKIILAGYRSDIGAILSEADCFLFPSKQEGLPVAVMEAMTFGLPIIASDIRGTVDLLDDPQGGYLIGGNSAKQFAEKMYELLCNGDERKIMGEWNKKKIKDFSIEKVSSGIRELYQIAEETESRGR